MSQVTHLLMSVNEEEKIVVKIKQDCSHFKVTSTGQILAMPEEKEYDGVFTFMLNELDDTYDLGITTTENEVLSIGRVLGRIKKDSE